jgi:hypothetical protein
LKYQQIQYPGTSKFSITFPPGSFGRPFFGNRTISEIGPGELKCCLWGNQL